MCAISSLTSTFAVSSPDEFLLFICNVHVVERLFLFPVVQKVFKNPPRNIKVIVKNEVAHVYGPPYILVSLTGNSRL